MNNKKKKSDNNSKKNKENKEEYEGEFLGISLGSYKTVYSVFSNFNKNYIKKIYEDDDGKKTILSKICYTESHRLYGSSSEPYLKNYFEYSYNNLGRLIGLNDSNFYNKEMEFMLNPVNSFNNFQFKIPKGKNNVINIDYKSVICDYLNLLNEKFFKNSNEFLNIIFVFLIIIHYIKEMN